VKAKTFKQFLEAAYSERKTLKTTPVKGTYVERSYEDTVGGRTVTDTEPKRGAWKAIRIRQVGHGWHALRMFVLLKPEPVIVEVTKVLGDGKHSHVSIISGFEQPVVEFAKRPYVSKKTGDTNPNIILSRNPQRLKQVFGVWTHDFYNNPADPRGERKWDPGREGVFMTVLTKDLQ